MNVSSGKIELRILLTAIVLLSYSNSDNGAVGMLKDRTSEISNDRNIIPIMIDTLITDHLSC